MDIIELASKAEVSHNEILSFYEYLNKIKESPRTQVRPSYGYLKDMFDHFGRVATPEHFSHDGKGGFQLFQIESPNSPPVHGQVMAQESLYQNLLNFIEEGGNHKFLLLVGPNGSAKSSLIRKIMEGAEIYSKLDEGSLYTFSWIFPIDSFVKGAMGLNSHGHGGELDSYAHLDDKDISSILTSELKDHPLLLLPLEARQSLIEELLASDKEALAMVKKSYLYYGDISKRNRMIFDSLSKNYQGDLTKVFKHIRVERFIISKRYSSSAVTIEPQLHVDARLQQITMDRRLASLPPGLQSLNLFSMHGEVVMANRGILEFSDLLKRPLDTFKYLLMTMETKTINMQGILTELDIFFIGSSNEIHLAAFKQHPDFNSFRGRVNFVRVPYLKDYQAEMRIYQQQLENLKDLVFFEPGALETLCMWAVMTRLRPSLSKNYKDKKMGEIANGLGPLEKVLIFAKGNAPERLNSEERKTLNTYLSELYSEFQNETLYEGKFGISPRDIKQIIYDMATKFQAVTFLEVLDYLQQFILRKNEFDFLNIAQQGDYHNPARFIEILRDYQVQNFDRQLRDALGLVDDRSYEDYIARYILNINCMLKGERIKNPITGQYQEVDSFLIKEFEKNVKIKEDPEKFRSHMISTLGAYSLDNPKEKIIYTKVFPDIVKSLKASFREEQKKVITNVAKNLLFYISEKEGKEETKQSLNEENRRQIRSIIDILVNKFSYSRDGAITMIKYLINKLY